MHLLDANKTDGENVRRELHKNSTSYFEQILGATPYETAAVWPPTSHLKNHPSKTNKIYVALLEK